MPLYSFSQLQLFNQCPLKYRYKYLDKIKTKDFEETADMLLGKAVHFALEKFYDDVAQFRKVDENTMIAHFESNWNDHYSDATVIKKDATAQDYLNRGRAYLAKYFEKYQTDDYMKVINTEEKIVFELDENIKFQGYIDRLDKVDKIFVINDYKTNIRLPSEDKTIYEEQLTLYGLGIKQKYGKYLDKIKARLYYLHFEIEDEWEIDVERLNQVVKKYKGLVHKIEDSRFKFNMGDKYAFDPQESPLCRFCDYQTICPLFSHAHMDDEIVLGEKTIKSLVDEYVSISNQMSENKAQKDYLKEVLSKYLQDNELKRLIGNNYQVTLSKLENYIITDQTKMEGLLKSQNKLEQAMSLDRFKIKKMIKESQIEYSKFKDCLELRESIVLKGKGI